MLNIKDLVPLWLQGRLLEEDMTEEDDDYLEREQERNRQKYQGVRDRRKAHRRSGNDRRDMIRFEPEKKDRRSGVDRRKGNRSGWDSGTSSV